MISLFKSSILLDPASSMFNGGGGGHPSGATATINLSKSALDETDHNKDPEPVDNSGDSKDNIFDIAEVTADKRVDQSNKLPSNQISKHATRTKQTFKQVEPTAKVADVAELDDPEAAPPTEEAVDTTKSDEEAEDEQDSETKDVKAATEKTNKSLKKEGEETDKTPEEAGNNLPRTRNYDGLDAEDVKILKGSNNYHYKKFRPLLDKYVAKAKEGETFKAKAAELEKTLTEKGVPPNWMEHPQAFTLTPEFNQLQDQYDRLTAEREFYESQLVNVKSGKPFVEIQGYDKTTGRPVLTTPREGTHADDVKLQGLIQRYGSAEAQINAKVAGMQATFQQTNQQATDAVRSALQQHVNNLIPELRPVKEEMEVFQKALPAVFKDRVPTEVAANLYSICIRQAHELLKYKEKEKTKARVANDTIEAGPNTKNLPRNGITNGSRSASGGKTIKLPNGRVVPASFDINELTGDND